MGKVREETLELLKTRTSNQKMEKRMDMGAKERPVDLYFVKYISECRKVFK